MGDSPLKGAQAGGLLSAGYGDNVEIILGNRDARPAPERIFLWYKLEEPVIAPVFHRDFIIDVNNIRSGLARGLECFE